MSGFEEVTIGDARLILGDCRDVLPTLAPVSAVVTDPPYGLKFMGKGWDYDVPPTDLWALVLDRLLPGGHLLAFAGTRTQHRMAVRIEDAGFEIRDMLAWVYGSGFPKSLDVGKAIDKAAGVEREVVGAMPDRWTQKGGTYNFSTERPQSQIPVTGEAAAEAARQWDGWGTALKPSFEPITLARKPLVGTVAQNVQAHGTGGLNIDGCRIPVEEGDSRSGGFGYGLRPFQRGSVGYNTVTKGGETGRWPANLIHDGSDEVVALFPQSISAGTAGTGKSGTYGAFERKETGQPVGFGDKGSSARFFYCAKAAGAERGAGNDHPTVKPIALMRWLLTLVTPPGGVVLDPFLGSGSTGVAAADLGVRFVGIERERRYFDIACERIARAQAQGQLLPHDAAPVLAQECLL